MRRNINGVETWQIYGFDGELVAEYAASAAAVVPQKEYGYRGGELLITTEGTTTTTANDSVWIEDSLPTGAQFRYKKFCVKVEINAGAQIRSTNVGHAGPNTARGSSVGV